MKHKLIACILGASIILSTGTPTMAEAYLASAFSAVRKPEVLRDETDLTLPPAVPQETPAETAAPQEPAVPPTISEVPAAGGEQTSEPPVTEVPSGESVVPGADPSGQSTGNAGTEDNVSGSGAGDADISSQSEGQNTENTGSSDTTDENAAASSAVSGTSSGTDEENTAESGEEDPEEETEEEPDEEVKVIGINGIADILVEKKPSLEECMAMLPTVLEGILSNGSRIQIPVDWACVSNFGDSAAERFTFASSLKKNADGTVYNIGHPIAPGVTFPAVSFVIKKEDKNKKADKRKESKDPVEEDSPLVMDDVTAANLSPDEGEEQVFSYLMKELGLNRAAACGVLANIHYESGFNSHAVGDGGTSYGLCQWHAGRYLSLVSYCGQIGEQYGSVEGQLKYMKQELINSYPHVLAYLQNVPETDVGAFDAAYYWCYYFECPAMILRQSTLRGNAAKNSYWPRYKDADPDSVSNKDNNFVFSVKQMTVLEERMQEAAEETAAEEKTVAEEYEALEPYAVQTVTEYRTAVMDAYKKAVLEERTASFEVDDVSDMKYTDEASEMPEESYFKGLTQESVPDDQAKADMNHLFVLN